LRLEISVNLHNSVDLGELIIYAVGFLLCGGQPCDTYSMLMASIGELLLQRPHTISSFGHSGATQPDLTEKVLKVCLQTFSNSAEARQAEMGHRENQATPLNFEPKWLGMMMMMMTMMMMMMTMMMMMMDGDSGDADGDDDDVRPGSESFRPRPPILDLGTRTAGLKVSDPGLKVSDPGHRFWIWGRTRRV